MRSLNTFQFIVTHPLNSSRKLKSVWRFLQWQVGSRILPGPVAVDFVNGSRLLVKPGMTGATGSVYTGLHEFEDMAFVLHVLQKRDLFVDIGANVGSYTILAGKAVGASCLSIEPVPQTFTHLMDNINLNGIQDRVTAYNIALGRKEGKLKFTSTLDAINHVFSEGDDDLRAIEVEVRTLDVIAAAQSPVLLKIDVEGFETDVIAGADKILSGDSLLAVIMELNGSGARYGYDEMKLHQRMSDYGFAPYTYDPFRRELLALKTKNSASGNTVYIRNLKEVLGRVRNSPMVSINGKQF